MLKKDVQQQLLPELRQQVEQEHLEELREIVYGHENDQAGLEWETQLQYAEDIQGAFFDHIITDAWEFEEIIWKYEASGKLKNVFLANNDDRGEDL